MVMHAPRFIGILGIFLKVVITYSKESEDVEEYARQVLMRDCSATVIAILQYIESDGVARYLKKSQKLDGSETSSFWLLNLLAVFHIWLQSETFNENWVTYQASVRSTMYMTMEVILNHISLPPLTDTKAVGRGSNLSDAVTTPLWSSVVATICDFLVHPSQRAELFDFRKSRISKSLHLDHRAALMSLLNRAVKSYSPSYAVPGTFISAAPPNFVSSMLTIACNSNLAVQNMAVAVLYSCIPASFALNSNLKKLEAEIIATLNRILPSRAFNSDSVDYMFSSLDARIASDSSEVAFSQATLLLKAMRRFSKILASLHAGKETDVEAFIGCNLRMVKFLRQARHKELLCIYTGQLYNIHMEQGNKIEAALSLKQHADLLKWVPRPHVTFVQLKDVNSHDFESDKKQAIYIQCIQLLCEGQAWEKAIEVCNQLNMHYLQTFDYVNQAENLRLQSSLFSKIVTELRSFAPYYRVQFYGTSFGSDLAGRQFIYRGNPGQQIGDFCEKMKAMYYRSNILTSMAQVDDSVATGSEMYIQICAMTAAPDFRNWSRNGTDFGLFGFSNSNRKSDPDEVTKESCPLWLYEPNLFFEDKEAKETLDFVDSIPEQVSAFYMNNEISTFTSTRPFRKPAASLVDHPAKEFLELYTEKVIVQTEESFPCQSRRSSIKQIIRFEIAPIENAIIAVRSKTKQLLNLMRKHEPPSDVKRDSISRLRESIGPMSPAPHVAPMNLSPFTMALKGAIDAPVNGGIPMYRSAFLTQDTGVSSRNSSGITESQQLTLRDAIYEQVCVC